MKRYLWEVRMYVLVFAEHGQCLVELNLGTLLKGLWRERPTILQSGCLCIIGRRSHWPCIFIQRAPYSDYPCIYLSCIFSEPRM